MSSRLCIVAGRIAVVIALSLSASTVDAAFHRWDFTEIFSNADGSIQFIEMHTLPGQSNEHQVSGHALKSNANTYVVPTNLPSATTGNKFFIFATAGFATLPGAVTPDYIIPDGFFDPAGDSLDWAGFDALSFTAGQLPLDGELSLLDNLTTAQNTPTNFAGAVGHIDITPAPTPGDTDGDGDVDLEDLNNVRNNFGGTGTDVVGDTNDDEVVDLEDLNAVRNNFGVSGSTSVPEPATGALVLLSLVAIGAMRKARRNL